MVELPAALILRLRYLTVFEGLEIVLDEFEIAGRELTFTSDEGRISEPFEIAELLAQGRAVLAGRA